MLVIYVFAFPWFVYKLLDSYRSDMYFIEEYQTLVESDTKNVYCVKNPVFKSLPPFVRYLHRRKKLRCLKLVFLYRGYRSDYFFFEVVVICRKITVAAVAVFVGFNQHIQALVVVLVVTVFLGIHMYALPYNDDDLNSLEFLSLSSGFGTFFFGQFLFIPPEVAPSSTKIMASFAIVLLNMIFMGNGFYHLTKAWLTECYPHLQAVGKAMNARDIPPHEYDPQGVLTLTKMIERYLVDNTELEDAMSRIAELWRIALVQVRMAKAEQLQERFDVPSSESESSGDDNAKGAKKGGLEDDDEMARSYLSTSENPQVANIGPHFARYLDTTDAEQMERKKRSDEEKGRKQLPNGAWR